MLPGLDNNTQKGYVAAVVVVFMLLISAFLYPWKFPKSNFNSPGGSQYCREFINDPDAPTINISGPSSGEGEATYKLIKKNVPINPSGFQGQHHVVEWGEITFEGKNYRILNPGPAAGKSYDFNTEDGITDITFNDYGLMYLLHLDDSENPELVEIQNVGLQIMDIYQDISKPPLPLAENILKCIDEGVKYVIDPKVLVPFQEVSPKKDQLQLEWFVIKQAKMLPKAWWTPECKPAIYLYPPSKQLVNVKVLPEGHLTYVDPPYDNEKGWTVWANPDGSLSTINDERITNNYLYYESKIRDEVIKKPETGWVVRGSSIKGQVSGEMKDLFKKILPQLGLNERQKNDFIDYWTKALPKSPYYFVGIIDQDNVNEIERLEITPKPDSMNRVRIYFERLDVSKIVEAPILSPISSLLSPDNFHVTEWGGMVKNDPNHPFTCSQ